MPNNDTSFKESNKENKLNQLSSHLIGKRLGEFEVKKELGRGGTSIVYEAYQPSLKRTVALKVLWTPFIDDPSQVERFHHEAEAAANLHHPNIVPIHEMGQKEDVHYFAMEMIEGKTLDDILDSERELSIERAVEIIKEVAKGVSYAHQQGIVHRDIKPSNIMIDKIGRILVTDFGLVKSKRWKKVTADKTVLGTPVYMSPEQAQGQETDARTDIYSLGVVLYQMLTKTVPFDADEPIAILRKVIDEDPQEPRKINKKIPKNLETIILKCLEKDPQNRYQTADLFLKDIEMHEAHLPLTKRRAELTFYALRRRKKLIKIATILILTMLVGGGLLSYFYRTGDLFKLQGISMQNFELNNGTNRQYFLDIWNCVSEFDTEVVHSGNRSLRVETFKGGGTVGINVVDEKGYVDLSNVKKISLWVYDTDGNNSIELRLRDIDGNGGNGPDGNTLWSVRRSKKDKWTQVSWNLLFYPKVENLDLTRIAAIEIYEYFEGIYCLDDLEF